MDRGLQDFLERRRLSLSQKLGRGHSSQIFLVWDRSGKKFVAKVERPDSTRFKMAEREAENLEKANSVGVGPKLVSFNLRNRIIFMEFIQGKTFAEWLFAGPSKNQLKSFIRELQRQAKALDKLGLDHGQLAGKGKNILVRKGKPVIIDFEKASSKRKCHNLSTIEAFLFKNPHGVIAKKVREILFNEKP